MELVSERKGNYTFEMTLVMIFCGVDADEMIDLISDLKNIISISQLFDSTRSKFSVHLSLNRSHKTRSKFDFGRGVESTER